MNNRIIELFSKQEQKVLSIFTTAGFPRLNDTVRVCRALERSGVGMIELGFPFSDPLADGPTIQASSEQALSNGMSLAVLFEQLQELRQHVSIPVLLMGYLNPVLQMGMDKFLGHCAESGVDGLILPDMPLNEYNELYRSSFEAHKISAVFLVTQQTSVERIREIDAASQGFIYVVSTAAVTGNKLNVDAERDAYFQRIRSMNLSNPLVVGFGIRDRESFDKSTAHTDGGIIGSAFVEVLRDTTEENLEETIQTWVAQFRSEDGAS